MSSVIRNIRLQHDIDKQNELRLPTLKEIFRGLTGKQMREMPKSVSKLQKQVMIKRVVLKSIIQSYISSGVTTEKKLKALGIDVDKILHPLPSIGVSGMGGGAGGAGVPDAPIDLSSVPQSQISPQGLRTELRIIETQIRQVMTQHSQISENDVNEIYRAYTDSLTDEDFIEEIAEEWEMTTQEVAQMMDASIFVTETEEQEVAVDLVGTEGFGKTEEEVKEIIRKRLSKHKGGRPPKGKKTIPSLLSRGIFESLMTRKNAILSFMSKGEQQEFKKTWGANPEMRIELLTMLMHNVSSKLKTEQFIDRLTSVKPTGKGGNFKKSDYQDIVNDLMENIEGVEFRNKINVILRKYGIKTTEDIQPSEPPKEPEVEGIMGDVPFRPLVRHLQSELKQLGFTERDADEYAIRLIDSMKDASQAIEEKGDIREGVNFQIGKIIDAMKELKEKHPAPKGLRTKTVSRLIKSYFDTYLRTKKTMKPIDAFNGLLSGLGSNDRISDAQLRSAMNEEVKEEEPFLDRLDRATRDIQNNRIFTGSILGQEASIIGRNLTDSLHRNEGRARFVRNNDPFGLSDDDSDDSDSFEFDLQTISSSEQSMEDFLDRENPVIEFQLGDQIRRFRLKEMAAAGVGMGLLIEMIKAMGKQRKFPPPHGDSGDIPNDPKTIPTDIIPSGDMSIPTNIEPKDDPNSYVDLPDENTQIMDDVVDPSENKLFVSTSEQVEQEKEDFMKFSIIPPLNGDKFTNPLKTHEFFQENKRYTNTYKNPIFKSKKRKIVRVAKMQPVFEPINHHRSKFQETIIQPASFTRIVEKDNAIRSEVYPDSIYFPDLGLSKLKISKSVNIPDRDMNDGIMRGVKNDDPKYEGGYEGQRDIDESGLYSQKFNFRTDRLYCGRNMYR